MSFALVAVNVALGLWHLYGDHYPLCDGPYFDYSQVKIERQANVTYIGIYGMPYKNHHLAYMDI